MLAVDAPSATIIVGVLTFAGVCITSLFGYRIAKMTSSARAENRQDHSSVMDVVKEIRHELAVEIKALASRVTQMHEDDQASHGVIREDLREIRQDMHDHVRDHHGGSRG